MGGSGFFRLSLAYASCVLVVPAAGLAVLLHDRRCSRLRLFCPPEVSLLTLE